MSGSAKSPATDLVSRMFSVVVLRILGAALGFSVTVVLARYLGAREVGVFFLSLTIVTISSAIARFGLDQVFLRFSAAQWATGHRGQLLVLHWYGVRTVIVLGTCATATLVSASGLLAGTFHEPLIDTALPIMAAAVIPFSLINLYGELLKGIRRTASALLVQSVGPSAFLLVLLPLVHGWGIYGVMIAYTAATAIVLFIAILLWRNAVRGLSVERLDWTWWTVTSLGFPFLVIGLTNLAITWTDTLMLGWWASTESVGIYGMAVRFATLSSFVLVAARSVIAPRFSELFAQGDVGALERTARASAAGMTLLSMPLFILLTIFPAQILGIGGAAFSGGDNALRILVCAQFAIVVTGSSGHLLSMTGNQIILRNINLWTAIVNALLNVALVPRFGINGAACATGLSLVGMNVVLVFVARRRLGVLSLPSFDRVFVRAVVQLLGASLGKNARGASG